MTATVPPLRRILFVDDEPNVLDGLKNLLRKHRRRWDMTFALGGQAALDEMARASVDVIVSDMRMPGMDGAELLTRVKNAYPSTARIVLSGHAERAAISRVISVAHQFLSKPCDAETVRIVVERTCDFQALLNDDGIRAVVGSLERLPSMPETYWELTRAAEDPGVGLDKIAVIVEKDPAISLKVLQLVNSAYFGLAQQTTSISKAVSYLGVENLKGLVILAQVFAAGGPSDAEASALDDLRTRSLLTANLARRIVRDRKLADEAFSAGLLHDVGKLILARDTNRPYGRVVEKARTSGRPLEEVEKEDLGTTHGIVGAYLLGVWGLPHVLAETVAYHHRPGMVAEGNCDVLAAVHIANALIDQALDGGDGGPNRGLDLAFVERMGIATGAGATDLSTWRSLATQAVAKVRAGN